LRIWRGDLQATSDQLGPDKDVSLSSSSLCTDINGERINCDLYLLNTLFSILANSDENSFDVGSDLDSDVEDITDITDEEATNTEPQHPGRPEENSNYIRYGFTGSTALSSSWKDSQYFTSAFPTLFPTGLGGHLDERSVKVSLEAFGKWALAHHTRR
jgi:hypothetical protein